MTTKPVTGIKVSIDKDGKPRLVRTRPFRARIKENKSAREVKAWEAKRKT